MRWKIAFAVSVLIAVTVWSCRSRTGAPPDARLAAHERALCRVAAENVDRPRRGVERWFAYLGANTPAIMKTTGELAVLIERIPDDAKHDARAREAARRLREPMVRCAPVFQRFFAAVQRDPDARRVWERGVERFARTLDIIFGGDGAALRGLLHVADLAD